MEVWCYDQRRFLYSSLFEMDIYFCLNGSYYYSKLLLRVLVSEWATMKRVTEHLQWMSLASPRINKQQQMTAYICPLLQHLNYFFFTSLVRTTNQRVLPRQGARNSATINRFHRLAEAIRNSPIRFQRYATRAHKHKQIFLF